LEGAVILALDTATKTGWALGDASGVVASGVWILDSEGFTRWRTLWRRLEDLFGGHGGQGLRVVHEAPLVMPGRESGARVAHGLIAVLEFWCEWRGCTCEQVYGATIRKHALGKGNAGYGQNKGVRVKGEGKRMMVEAAAKKWPSIRIADDNHADALHLLDYALSGKAM
jgi:hypothetical protein